MRPVLGIRVQIPLGQHCDKLDMDIAGTEAYGVFSMSKVARILAAVLLAVFAAGTGAHAAAATDMSLKMSMASMDDCGMSDCQDCPGDETQGSACDQVCVTTLAAICPPAAAELPHVGGVVSSPFAKPSDGRTGPPDPYPPRTTFLS